MARSKYPNEYELSPLLSCTEEVLSSEQRLDAVAEVLAEIVLDALDGGATDESV
jgi:hypothetical protein